MKTGPLDGVTVLDLTQIYNGPYATFLLAAAGADVIKIEPPGGEHLRRRADGASSQLQFAMLNAGKRSLRLNLKTDAGRGILLDLVEKADVVVENFAPGVMERLQLSYEILRQRNPAIILASSSGYGSTGPYRDYPAMDLTVQAMSGIMSATGMPEGPSLKTGAAICDFTAGVHLYGAIVTCLFQRQRTGRGQFVEVAMLDACYFSLSSVLGLVHADSGQQLVTRTGNRHGGLSLCPYNVYPARNGQIAIIVNHDAHWRALTQALGKIELAEDPRYATTPARVAHMAEVDDLVADWTRGRDWEELCDLLMANRVPAAPVREVREVMNDLHLHQRGALKHIVHPQYGDIIAAASPLRFGGEASLPERPSAALGADAHEILREMLCLDDTEIADLKESGII